jgi:hypothetical protein
MELPFRNCSVILLGDFTGLGLIWADENVVFPEP